MKSSALKSLRTSPYGKSLRTSPMLKCSRAAPPLPREQPPPVLLPHHHDGDPADLPRLDEGERLEELVERSEPAGHDDISRGVFDEHHLAREEMLEVEGLVLVPVHPAPLGAQDVVA